MNETNRIILNWVMLDIEIRGLKEQFNNETLSHNMYYVLGAPLQDTKERLGDQYHIITGAEIHTSLPRKDPTLDLSSFIKSLI